jgi:hypothetical protein
LLSFGILMGVIELNRKILGIAVILMTVAMLATPVMAVSPKKISITATASLIPGSMDYSDPKFRSELNEGGVLQLRALHSKENVYLTIGDSPSSIHFVAELTTNGRWKTPRDQVNHVKVVWTDDTKENGFDGVLQWKILFEGPAGPECGTWHGVLQGWGMYEGQKLQLEGFWNGGPTKGPSTYTGFLLTP